MICYVFRLYLEHLMYIIIVCSWVYIYGKDNVILVTALHMIFNTYLYFFNSAWQQCKYFKHFEMRSKNYIEILFVANNSRVIGHYLLFFVQCTYIN
jgi:hypothetical protein